MRLSSKQVVAGSSPACRTISMSKISLVALNDINDTAKNLLEGLVGESFTFPAGRYWVGDLCYVYPDEEWGQFCDADFGKTEHCIDKDGAIGRYHGGYFFFVAGTAYGDGIYPLRKNGQVLSNMGVDAGLLALVPMELVSIWGTTSQAYDLGVVINCEKPFTVSMLPSTNKYRSGNWAFLDYEVITDWSDEEDEEEDFDEGDEYDDNGDDIVDE